MFETTIPFPPDRETGTDRPLRALDWGELVARLEAQRQLRADGSLARRRSRRASFDPHAARRLFDQGKHDVNLDDLEGRKADRGISSPTAEGAESADREMS